MLKDKKLSYHFGNHFDLYEAGIILGRFALDVYKRQVLCRPNRKLNESAFLLPYSLRNGSMVMAKKIVFEIIADSDSTTLKT